MPPVKRIRVLTTVHEGPANNVLSEPTFDRQPIVPRRQSTLRSPPMVSGRPSVFIQPTVQERRSTFEGAITVPSRPSTIVSDPTNMAFDSPIVSRVSTRQATLRESPPPSRNFKTLGRMFTESISKQPTRCETDVVVVPASASRQVTRRVIVPPLRKPSEYEVPGLIRQNAEESSDVEESYEELEEPPFVERQPTVVSQTPARVPIEQKEDTEVLERRTTRHPILLPEIWEESDDVGDAE